MLRLYIPFVSGNGYYATLPSSWMKAAMGMDNSTNINAVWKSCVRIDFQKLS